MIWQKDFEKMTSRRYEYVKGLNGHSEIALYVDTFDEVDDVEYKEFLRDLLEAMYNELPAPKEEIIMDMKDNFSIID